MKGVQSNINQYEFLKKIGEGSFSSVYKGITAILKK